MLSKRLASTSRSISAAAAVAALCLAMSGGPAHASEVETRFNLPEVGDEVLTYDARTRPHADGIIAILIGAIGKDAGSRDG